MTIFSDWQQRNKQANKKFPFVDAERNLLGWRSGFTPPRSYLLLGSNVSQSSSSITSKNAAEMKSGSSAYF
jgi:hypothetical protein